MSCGLGISTNNNLQRIAGLHADKEMFTVLRELGMPLSETVVNAAALSGRLSILQHLLFAQQCPSPDNLGYCAARSGSINMLNWLRTQSWCSYDDVMACLGAARGGHLAVLQYLYSKGCGWNTFANSQRCSKGWQHRCCRVAAAAAGQRVQC
jgi:hypothetical protein